MLGSKLQGTVMNMITSSGSWPAETRFARSRFHQLSSDHTMYILCGIAGRSRK